MIYEKDLVEALHLSIVLPSPTGELPIEDADTCRPGLQLTGYWDFFAYERPQLFGKVEMAYLNTLDEETLNARLNTFFSFRLPCVIVCRDLPIPEPMLRCARQRKVPIYRTQANTVKLEMDIINYLNTALAPIRTMHGVLVDVYGVGLMITGNSGVGKSSILNQLCPSLSLPTGSVSDKLGRGRHTTRHVELYDLGYETYVADTPGFASFEVDLIEPIRCQDLQYAFREFQPYLGTCRFQDCAHLKEPDCSILQALQEGKIAPERHQSYARLYESARRIPEWQKT